MLSREQALNAVSVGDMIFGIAAGGQEKLLLVYDASRDGFSARHVTTQMTFSFGRDGKTRQNADGGYIAIVSTAALPTDLYEATLALDRKLGEPREYPDTKLTSAEIQLLLTHAKFFQARLLPGAEAIVKAAQKLNGVKKVLQLEWDPIDAPRNPPAWGEYDSYVPALVAMIENRASAGEVAGYLAEIAAQRKRTLETSGQDNAASASLLRLRQSWT